MIYETNVVQLKNGKAGVFRSPTIEDAATLLDYLKITAEETPFLMRCPDECTMTLEQEQEYLRNRLTLPEDVVIMCEVDGIHAGNCNLTRKDKRRTCHRAVIGIALKKEFWGLGIGTAMLEEMIRLAKEWGVEQLELEVFEGNERAIALYEKMGFRIAAAKPNAIRLQDGTTWKEYYMVKELPLQPNDDTTLISL